MTDNTKNHPLQSVFDAVIAQVTSGKGVRHGGDSIPFTKQPWSHYAGMHGRGFLTGQAAKKLEEAATTRWGPEFENEMLGAIVYCAMAILHERENTSLHKRISDGITAEKKPEVTLPKLVVKLPNPRGKQKYGHSVSITLVKNSRGYIPARGTTLFKAWRLIEDLLVHGPAPRKDVTEVLESTFKKANLSKYITVFLDRGLLKVV